MTDHRVERVHGLVGQRGRHAAGDEKTQRRDDAIACAFGERLDDAASDVRLAERGGVAADDPRQPGACRWQIVLLECMNDAPRFGEQRSGREHCPCEEHFGDKRDARMKPSRDRQHQHCRGGRHGDDGNGHSRALHQIARGRVLPWRRHGLARGDHPAHRAHWMRKPFGIAGDHVHRVRAAQHQRVHGRPSHPRSASTSSAVSTCAARRFNRSSRCAATLTSAAGGVSPVAARAARMKA